MHWLNTCDGLLFTSVFLCTVEKLEKAATGPSVREFVEVLQKFKLVFIAMVSTLYTNSVYESIYILMR